MAISFASNQNAELKNIFMKSQKLLDFYAEKLWKWSQKKFR